MPGNNTITEAYLSCRSYLARAVSCIVPPHEIEDIVQETYVRVCQFKPKEEVKSPRALMVRIARNLALDHIKRAEWRLTGRIEEDSEMEIGGAARLVDDTFKQVTSDEDFVQFCEAVRQLPLQCRRVFVLKKVYGYSQKEIARELNISESTVEKHIAKGMKLCVYFMLEHAENNMGSSPELKQAVSGKGGRQ